MQTFPVGWSRKVSIPVHAFAFPRSWVVDEPLWYRRGGGVGLEDDQSYLTISLGCTWPLVWFKPTKFKGQGCDCLWGSQAHSNSNILEEGSYGLTD